MRIRKKQFILYLEVDRNIEPEKIDNIIRSAFRGKYTPKVRTLLTAINHKNLKSIISQPLLLTERELNVKTK